MQKEYFSTKENELFIDGVSSKKIIKKYGTPLYVYSQKKIEDVANSYKKSLNDNYGFGEICYASKAFCCKEIYRLMKDLNMGIDLVSGGELYTAKSVDFPLEKAVFHGNNKSDEEIESAIIYGVNLLVIDSFSEAKRIDEIAKKHNKIQSVLVRVNPGIEAHTHEFIKTSKIDSKFGFSIDSGEALDVIKEVVQLKNVSLKGLHCHIGSQIFEQQSFLLTVDKMLDFYFQVKKVFCIDFDVLDLGGGFGIWYNEDDKYFSNDDYYLFLKTIIERIKENLKKYNLKKPFLIFEPGRSIVGEAGITFYTVGSVKEIKNVKTYLAIDGGMFENPRFALYSAKYSVIAPLKMDETCKYKYSIAGKCCESGDKIREDCFLPKIQEGDFLAVLSTGAYNYSMASNYNRNLVPAVVFVKDGKTKIVVKRQKLKDIIKFDV